MCCILLNYLLVYQPHLVEEEGLVLAVFILATLAVAGATTAYSYFLEGMVPPAYIKLTHCGGTDDSMEMPQPSVGWITSRSLLFLFAPVTFVGFKAGTKKTLFPHDAYKQMVSCSSQQHQAI